MNPPQTILKCLNVKKDEKVLIIADKNTQNIAHEILKEAVKLAHTSLKIIPVGKQNGDEPPKETAEEMLNYDVIIAPTTTSLTHTKATINAKNKGARIATLPGITKEIFKGSLMADYKKIELISKKVYNKVKKAKAVKVKTKNGSEFEFLTKNREWLLDTGKITEKGRSGNLPAGEVFIAPFEGTFNGIIVIDFFKDKGIIYAKQGTKIEIKNGNVINCSDKNSKMNDYFKKIKNSKNLAEFGIGTNYKAKIIGNILQDEKVMGTCHVAFGNNSSMGGKVYSKLHMDTILQKPTIEVDGKIIMKDGKFI